MVMEIPTPQCVGREFVRQYYTLLNKAPLHLHRFYNHDSSFLHGGLDRPGQETKPVVGQQDIHERIMQLNFRDCHAKIRQVDSLETLGDGVVVQVSGELSNNGQPMRRFMQTFVLAPQSPKKYYVRNDIFRYQDDIFTEDEDGEIDNALTDIDVEEQSTNQKNSSNLTTDEDVVYHENEIVRNGSVYASDNVGKFATPQPPRETTVSPQPELEVESTKSDWDDDEEDEEDEDLDEEEIGTEGVVEDNSAPETLESPPAASQEPKTYANMVSKNTSANVNPNLPVTSNATSPVSSLPAIHKVEPVAPYYPKLEGTVASAGQVVRDKIESEKMDTHRRDCHHDPRKNESLEESEKKNQLFQDGLVSSSFGPQANRTSRPRLNSNRGRFDGNRDPSTRSPEDFDAEKRKPSFIHHPDSHQLFVGNLTHSITEEDLKSHFTRFGKVLDMRINTKQPQKIGGGKVPNFGFIVFDDADAVQKVLSSRPIFFNEHRLNVEEKKRPKDNRSLPCDNRVGLPRGGLSPRVGVGGRGPRGGMMSQGTGRADNRGGMRGGSYAPRR